MKNIGEEIESNTEGAALGLVFGRELGINIEPKYKNHVVIDSQSAKHHIERTNEYHPELAKYLRIVFDLPAPSKGGIPKELTPEYIERKGSGFQICAGFLNLLLKLKDAKVPVVLRHPESCLHPSNQARLGEVLARITGAQK